MKHGMKNHLKAINILYESYINRFKFRYIHYMHIINLSKMYGLLFLEFYVWFIVIRVLLSVRRLELIDNYYQWKWKMVSKNACNTLLI